MEGKNGGEREKEKRCHKRDTVWLPPAHVPTASQVHALDWESSPCSFSVWASSLTTEQLSRVGHFLFRTLSLENQAQSCALIPTYMLTSTQPRYSISSLNSSSYMQLYFQCHSLNATTDISNPIYAISSFCVKLFLPQAFFSSVFDTITNPLFFRWKQGCHLDLPLAPFW